MKKIILYLIFQTLFLNYSFSQPNCDTLIFDSFGSKLKGYFYSSQSDKRPTLIFTQGFFERGDIWDIGKTLAAKGVNVFLFDFSGCFESEGKQGLINSQKDIDEAVEFIRKDEIVNKYRLDPMNIILGGYSYGGHMSMLYAVHHNKVKRVISISGGDLGIFGNLVNSNIDLRKAYSAFFESIRKPKGPVDFSFEDPIQELLDNLDYFDILNNAEKLSYVDVLMTGGLNDDVVSLEEYVLPLYRKLMRNKKQKIKCYIYQSGHSYKGTASTLLNDILNWIMSEN